MRLKYLITLVVFTLSAADASACFTGPLARLRDRRASHASTVATTSTFRGTTRTTMVPMPAPAPTLSFRLVPGGCPNGNCPALAPQKK